MSGAASVGGCGKGIGHVPAINGDLGNAVPVQIRIRPHPVKTRRLPMGYSSPIRVDENDTPRNGTDQGSKKQSASNPRHLRRMRRAHQRRNVRFALAFRHHTRKPAPMPTLAIVFGLILDALGLGAYFFSEAKSVTALIPAFFGTTILLCGIIGAKFHKARMHVMHVAALVGLLGTLGGLGMGLPKVGALLAGTAERPMAVTMQIVMGVVSLVFLALCVKSFVDARILKKYSKQ